MKLAEPKPRRGRMTPRARPPRRPARRSGGGRLVAAAAPGRALSAGTDPGRAERLGRRRRRRSTACSRTFPTILTAARHSTCAPSRPFGTGMPARPRKDSRPFLPSRPPPPIPKGMVPAVRLKRIQCWVALKRWKDALEGAQAEKATLAAGDPSIAELDYVSGQALLGLGRARRSSGGVSGGHRGSQGRRAGGPGAVDAWRNLLSPGPVSRGAARFSQGRHPARFTALAGGRAARGGKSLRTARPMGRCRRNL